MQAGFPCEKELRHGRPIFLKENYVHFGFCYKNTQVLIAFEYKYVDKKPTYNKATM